MQGSTGFTSASSGAGDSVIFTTPRFRGYGEEIPRMVLEKEQKETARLWQPERMRVKDKILELLFPFFQVPLGCSLAHPK